MFGCDDNIEMEYALYKACKIRSFGDAFVFRFVDRMNKLLLLPARCYLIRLKMYQNLIKSVIVSFNELSSCSLRFGKIIWS